MDNILIPPPLSRGDKIRIVTPATVVRPEYITSACTTLRHLGYEAELASHIATGSDGSLAGTAMQRAEDITAALEDRDVKAIWCGRGGYGCVELLPHIDGNLVTSAQKWLIGFSDICALHALWLNNGVACMHAPMLRTFGTFNEPMATINATGVNPNYTFASSPANIYGHAAGPLLGGNLSVICDLIGTPFDMFKYADGAILLLEDVGETINKVKRRLWHLYLSGILHRARALLFGRFSAYQPTPEYSTMEEMIHQCLRQWNITKPTAYNIPIGHGGENLPIIEGGPTKLTITSSAVAVAQSYT